MQDKIELASLRKRIQELKARKTTLSAYLIEMKEVMAGTRSTSTLSVEIMCRFSIDVEGTVDRFQLRGIELKLDSLVREADAKIFKLQELLDHAAKCSRCDGSGSIATESIERDPDNIPVSTTTVTSCPECSGSGKTEREVP